MRLDESNVPMLNLPLLVAARILSARGDVDAAAAIIARCEPFLTRFSATYFCGYETLRVEAREKLKVAVGPTGFAAAERRQLR